MPRHQSSILENVQPFAYVCKHNYDVIIYELESRWTTFERTKIIPKGKTTKVGVNQLISVLRTTVWPDEEEESKSMSKEEKAKYEFSLPNYLTSKD